MQPKGSFGHQLSIIYTWRPPGTQIHQFIFIILVKDQLTVRNHSFHILAFLNDYLW